MGKVLVLLLAGFFFLPARSQVAGYTQLKDVDAFKKAFRETAAKTRTIRSDFLQEKNLSLLADKIVSRGHFWFTAPDKVRMEYTNPYTYLIVLNAGKIFIRDGSKENRISSGSSKVFQQVNRIMVDCVGGTILSNPDFSATIWSGSGGYLIRLTPVAKNLKALYRTIDIFLGADLTATGLLMTEVSGDSNAIRFTNKTMNGPLDDELFDVH